MHIGFNCLTLRGGEYGGVQVALRGLVHAVAAAAAPGDRITLYASDDLPGTWLPAGETVRATAVPAWARWRPGRILYEQALLPWRVRRDGLDVLHCPVYLAPSRARVPVVLNVHDAFALLQPQYCTRLNGLHFRWRLPASLQTAARVIVPSAQVRHELVAWNGIRRRHIADLATKLQVVPWGVDARFRPVEDEGRRRAVRERYGLNGPYVIHVGRNEPKKNLKSVLEAFFAATLSANLPHRLLLAGPGGWGTTEKTRRLIGQLALTEKVIEPGFVAEEDLPVLYSAASLLLFPSNAEGFGFPVLEAMACGCPVVCAEIPALRELAGDAARLVGAYDLPAQRVALEEILADRQRAEAMRQKGLARAEAFTWAKHAEAVWAIYREVAGGASSVTKVSSCRR